MASSERRGKRRAGNEPLSDHRFVEPRLGAGRVLSAVLLTVVVAVLAGSGVGFLVSLGAWLTLEEGFPDVWSDGGLDPVSRLNLGGTALVAAVAGALYPVALALDRLLLGRQLARLAREAPLDVPPLTVRKAVSHDPYTPLLILSRVLIGLAVTVALINLLLWAETDDDVASMLVLGGAVFGTGGLVVLCGALARWRRDGWPELLSGPRRVWSEQTVAATRQAERARRPRLSGVPDYGRLHRFLARSYRRAFVAGSATLAGGAAIGFLGVFLRQPGRNADKRFYGEFGEGVIDLLSVAGAVIAAVGILLLLVCASGGTIQVALERSALRRTLRSHPDRGPTHRVVERQLVVPAPATTVGATLVGAAVVVLEPLGAALVVAAEPQHPLAEVVGGLRIIGVGLLALVLLGGVLIAVGRVGGRSFREEIRRTWHPGDDPAPLPTRGTRGGAGDGGTVIGGDAGDRRHDGDGGSGGSDGGGSDGGGGDGGGGGGDGGGGGGD